MIFFSFTWIEISTAKFCRSTTRTEEKCRYQEKRLAAHKQSRSWLDNVPTIVTDSDNVHIERNKKKNAIRFFPSSPSSFSFKKWKCKKTFWKESQVFTFGIDIYAQSITGKNVVVYWLCLRLVCDVGTNWEVWWMLGHIIDSGPLQLASHITFLERFNNYGAHITRPSR